MNNSGLTSRLRQQSRRTGLAVGFAMAVTIALCIGIFVVAYAGVDPLTRDFIARSSPTPTSTSGGSADTADTNGGGNNQTEGSSSSNNESSSANDDNREAPEPTDTPEPTPTPEEFVADYLSNTEQGVNFRAGPGTDNDVLLVLDASTPLQSTGNEQEDDSGTVWMEFETRDGTTGWIRQIDAVPNS